MEVFVAVEDDLSVVAPLLATYRRDLDCRIDLSLYLLPATYGLLELAHPATAPDLEAARLVATTAVTGIADNAHAQLFVTPGAIPKGSLCALKVSSPDASPGRAATAWTHREDQKMEGHLRCFFAGVDQGEYGLIARTFYVRPVAEGEVPRGLLYSPVTQCNLNCIHCISRDTRKTKNILCMSIKDDIRSWCAKGWVDCIITDYSGDILWADARFGGELDFLIELDVPFHIDTNGAHLTREVSRKLIETKLMSLNVSLDAATTSTFQRIRKGAPPLEDVLGNIAAFAEIRRETGVGTRVPLSLGFTLMRSNIHEWEDCIRNAAAVGADAVIARHIEAYTPDMAEESLFLDRETFNRARTSAIAVARELGIALQSEPELTGSSVEGGHEICVIPWESAVVLGNGDVAVCCTPKTTIGNLHDQSMQGIWNGPAYREFRRRVNSPRPPAQCEGCGMRRSRTNSNSYMPYRTIATWVPPKDWPTGVETRSDGPVDPRLSGEGAEEPAAGVSPWRGRDRSSAHGARR
ncbi:SPASM domain-containing protein [Hansschlegelia sp. KR7-227]|uniref:SPASM domain-containing protein n=1 Tax=Hansschlegelia sp. KR7-227 TaxID=3400914 RepID=UPI003C1148BD